MVFMDLISIILGIVAIALAASIPGYALSLAIFPKRGELDIFERIAFSFILSIAVPALVILAESMLLKIPINFISAASTYAAITLIGLFAFALRSRAIKQN